MTPQIPAGFTIPANEGAAVLTSLGAAVATHIRPHDVVHVAYSDARPNAALHEIVRQWAGKDPRLTLVTAGLVSSQHALVETGVVTKVIASFAGENLPTPRPNRAFQRAVADGRVEVESWSLWSLTARLMAGALGVPHLPVRSLVGSDMANDLRGKGFRELSDEDGETYGAVSPLRPDVVLLHAVAADRAGNVVMSAPYGEGAWGALAAKRGVIVSAERIVDTAAIREHAYLVRIPAHTVLAVCEVPFGSHPYGLYNPAFPGVADYVEDEAFVGEAFGASRSAEGFRAWIDEWILGTADHAAYLHRLGERRLGALRAAADPPHGQEEPAVTGGHTRAEAMIVTASRVIADRIRDGGHHAVLAGVGQANLAAWLAVTELKRTGADVELMAEIGMFGYRPRPGEPFIFAKRNLPTCTMLTDVATVLGAFVGGPATRSFGVIGAAQIDQAGDINSTWSADGQYLVGSGGANDVANADEVLVTVDHRRSRLVRKVPFVTCPGRAVRTVVTPAAVFERDPDRFVLTGIVGTPGPGGVREAVAAIRAECEWEFEVAAEPAVHPVPGAEELRALRLFDPRRHFLGRLGTETSETRRNAS
ncbi:glutaconate CoA-transferase [Amycolatopsis antarctica]|uniref:Glutaconate CoA-transferase n=1 Tax=Amycolatopsis antarctica TaxID=1854586 RepID=A0A263D0X4_9PSEU|nr:CoA-transferase [Amycolatopsis antarctica]OZM72083.1 glutaconate CoA-transferase [Amycolatopsis antarctica]